jgi:hypothetical protein
MLMTWSATRFFSTLRVWDVLVEFESSLSPGYLSVTGAGWGVAGGVLLWGMITAKAWTRRASVISALLWLIQYWVERGVLYRSPNPNLVFAVISSALVLVVVLASALHKSTKVYLTRSEEYEQQNENPNPE